MKTFWKSLVGAFVIGTFILSVAKVVFVATADTDLTGCGTLSVANETYVLTQNIGSGSDCVIVTADNIVIDLGGFTVTGNIVGNGSSTANHTDGYDFTVRNGTVDGDIVANGATGAQGADGVDREQASNGSDGYDDGFGNYTSPTRGNDGEAGEDGHPGEAGGYGGILTITDVIVDDIQAIGGTGGIGGVGGNGGAGGSGGWADYGYQTGDGGNGGVGGRNGRGGTGGLGGSVIITGSSADSVTVDGGTGGDSSNRPGIGGAGGNAGPGNGAYGQGGIGGNGGDGENGGAGGMGGAVDVVNSLVASISNQGGIGGQPYPNPGDGGNGGTGSNGTGANGTAGSVGSVGVSGDGGEINTTDDAPQIELVGASEITLTEGDIYIEHGATATDAKDGELTPVITGSVNAAAPGTYTLTYTATDLGTTITANGEETEYQEPQSVSVTRTVTVIEEDEPRRSSSRKQIVSTPSSNQANTDTFSGTHDAVLVFGTFVTEDEVRAAEEAFAMNNPLLVPIVPGIAEDEVLAETHVCKPFITKDIVFGAINDVNEVSKLQSYLIESEGEALEVNGVYDAKTRDAVNRYQLKYKDFLLVPYGLTEPTGNVYTLTRTKINGTVCAEIYGCPYFTGYHEPGTTNEYIKRIKGFLNMINPGSGLDEVSGLYDEATQISVKQLQLKYKGKILTPNGLTEPNGYWYKDTRKTANEFVGCIDTNIAQ